MTVYAPPNQETIPLDRNGNRITPLYTVGFTQKQKILKILLDERLSNRARVHIDGGPGNQVIRSGGYIAMHDLNHICSSRDRRLRELRTDHQIPISDPPHKFTDATYYDSQGNQKSYSVPQYRIELTPDEIRNMDWSRFWEIPFAAMYSRPQMEYEKTQDIDYWICSCRQYRVSDLAMRKARYEYSCPKCKSPFGQFHFIIKQDRYHTEENGQTSFLGSSHQGSAQEGLS